MLPYDDVQPGRHYVYLVEGRKTLDEEIVAVDARGVTLRVVVAGGKPVTRTLPPDVLTYLKTYQPTFALADFGTNGYDVAYFRKKIATAGRLPATDGTETITVSGRAFACATRFDVRLVKFAHEAGCLPQAVRTAVAPVYPFTLRYTVDGEPGVILQAIR